MIPASAVGAVRKHFAQTVHRLALPGAHLVRMHLVLGRDLLDRLVGKTTARFSRGEYFLGPPQHIVPWGKLRRDFLEGVGFAQGLELETREKGERRAVEDGVKIGRRRRRQKRDAKNLQKKPGLSKLDLAQGSDPPYTYSPFRTQIDQELLSLALDYVRDPPPVIQDSLEKEIASTTFVEAWGKFSYALGIIDANYMGHGDGLYNERRGGLGRGESSSDWHKQYFVDWVSAYMSRLQAERGNPQGHDRDWRKHGERAFVDFVTKVLSGSGEQAAPEGDPTWFKEFIKVDAKKPGLGPELKKTYSSIGVYISRLTNSLDLPI